MRRVIARRSVDHSGRSTRHHDADPCGLVDRHRRRCVPILRQGVVEEHAERCSPTPGPSGGAHPYGGSSSTCRCQSGVPAAPPGAQHVRSSRPNRPVVAGGDARGAPWSDPAPPHRSDRRVDRTVTAGPQLHLERPAGGERNRYREGVVGDDVRCAIASTATSATERPAAADGDRGPPPSRRSRGGRNDSA